MHSPLTFYFFTIILQFLLKLVALSRPTLFPKAKTLPLSVTFQPKLTEMFYGL